jgi:hypothetical protein
LGRVVGARERDLDVEAAVAWRIGGENGAMGVGDGSDDGQAEPVGFAQSVRRYYCDFVAGGGAVFESPKDRIVVDDHNVVSEAEVRNVVPGPVAKRRGYRVPDESGHYLVRFRNLVVFEFGDDPTRALGEDSYSTFDPDAFERVDDADLPQAYLDYLAELSVATSP